MLSNSENALARIRVSANNASAEIELLNGQGDVVADGVGTLDTRVAPGLYELQYGTGARRDHELLALRSGDDRVRQLTVEVRSAAPLERSAQGTAQRAAAATITARGAGKVAARPEGQCVIFVRQVGQAKVGQDVFGPLALVDEAGVVVSELAGHEGDHIVYDADGQRWAAAYISVPPGGYALRFAPAPIDLNDPALSGPVTRAFDQSVWITDGWQTVVFVPTAAVGPVPQFASVHTVRSGATWDPSSPATLALETMLVCLRDGQGKVRSDIRELVRDPAVGNPMLGIVAAHTILLDRTPNFELFDAILDTLISAWPDFPDIRALGPLGQEQRLRATPQARLTDAAPPNPLTPPVTWPPMLLRSYQGLLRADAQWPSLNIIAEGSVAERAVGRLLVGSLWSAWQPLDARVRVGVRGGELVPPGEAPDLPGEGWLHDLKIGILRVMGKSVTADDWRHAIRSWQPTDATSLRLKTFLTEEANYTDQKTLRGFVTALNASDVSVASGLPVRIVQQALDQIRTMLDASAVERR